MNARKMFSYRLWMLCVMGLLIPLTGNSYTWKTHEYAIKEAGNLAATKLEPANKAITSEAGWWTRKVGNELTKEIGAGSESETVKGACKRIAQGNTVISHAGYLSTAAGELTEGKWTQAFFTVVDGLGKVTSTTIGTILGSPGGVIGSVAGGYMGKKVWDWTGGRVAAAIKDRLYTQDAKTQNAGPKWGHAARIPAGTDVSSFMDPNQNNVDGTVDIGTPRTPPATPSGKGTTPPVKSPIKVTKPPVSLPPTPVPNVPKPVNAPVTTPVTPTPPVPPPGSPPVGPPVTPPVNVVNIPQGTKPPVPTTPKPEHEIEHLHGTDGTPTGDGEGDTGKGDENPPANPQDVPVDITGDGGNQQPVDTVQPPPVQNQQPSGPPEGAQKLATPQKCWLCGKMTEYFMNADCPGSTYKGPQNICPACNDAWLQENCKEEAGPYMTCKKCGHTWTECPPDITADQQVEALGGIGNSRCPECGCGGARQCCKCDAPLYWEQDGKWPKDSAPLLICPSCGFDNDRKHAPDGTRLLSQADACFTGWVEPGPGMSNNPALAAMFARISSQVDKLQDSEPGMGEAAVSGTQIGLGSLHTFIAKQDEKNAGETKDGFENMSDNTAISEGSTAGDGALEQAKIDVNNAGGVAGNKGDETAGKIAIADQSNSWTRVVIGGVLVGIKTGLVNVVKPIGEGAVDGLFGHPEPPPTPTTAGPSHPTSGPTGTSPHPTSGHGPTGGHTDEPTGHGGGGEEPWQWTCPCCGYSEMVPYGEGQPEPCPSCGKTYSECGGASEAPSPGNEPWQWSCPCCGYSEMVPYGESQPVPCPSCGKTFDNCSGEAPTSPLPPEPAAEACIFCGQPGSPVTTAEGNTVILCPTHVEANRCSVCGRVTQDMGGMGYGYTTQDGQHGEESINNACLSCRNAWQQRMQSEHPSQ